MCNCKNIEMGSYDNSYAIQKPFGRKNFINVDKCIIREILDLWEAGIETAGCCCGHNKVKPMINVSKSHHDKMIELNYKFYLNQCGVKCYTPKTKLLDMENTSKSNLKYQFDLIMNDVKDSLIVINNKNILELDCNDLIEKLEGIKEIQIALKTLTN